MPCTMVFNLTLNNLYVSERARRNQLKLTRAFRLLAMQIPGLYTVPDVQKLQVGKATCKHPDKYCYSHFINYAPVSIVFINMQQQVRVSADSHTLLPVKDK